MRLRTTVSGWEVTLVTPVIVSLPTMVTNSPHLTGTTTSLLSAVPVPQPMEGGGGSTGEHSTIFLSVEKYENTSLLVVLRQISMANTSKTRQKMATTEESYGSCGLVTTLSRRLG